eukprot:gnl/MRDRNA2_/MRDRNA2_123536_c0_seq1.p1 gnl/MRDRNA2_/MRDRNA2_123536_c0~~gnl/MRDRNA2_/MRDRNA2_123536_c0_seq1.p1  ORF type:complete len:264 (+),score=53.84 gnl/MRDRNA2_/MRDRNA2_123536_c0_seq1:53-844(+)
MRMGSVAGIAFLTFIAVAHAKSSKWNLREHAALVHRAFKSLRSDQGSLDHAVLRKGSLDSPPLRCAGCGCHAGAGVARWLASSSDSGGEEFDGDDFAGQEGLASSTTFPKSAGSIRKGQFCMLKGHPCKVSDVSSSKTGKHGHAKVNLVGTDIFTGKKHEDMCPSSHNMDVPHVERKDYQLLLADGDTGEVSLLQPDGSTKDDVELPARKGLQGQEPTDEDRQLEKDILKYFNSDSGNDIYVTLLSACDMQKIVAVKSVAPKT